ncbi:LytTR family DNA-binding domain-containing protein [Phaeovulum sp.]|uniref:LytTR family DNA-binding domain-containing protein n=1 Tax=Phaeovulum sp. TaxID=2934796 RepID=UPI00272FE8E1|nr:LytTR family DNA-binding domain-containing protein [Phaeovulum sp.]MDP1667497.1 LytTR family DNA-binding domain-containing protein [Phaeovulum sp.]MDZ4120014.1 LytTR family DNA-binding domain-containing protein [Phaeovulum sp.]
MASFFQQWKANLLFPATPVIWAAISFFGIIAGPFGTLNSLSLELRLVFWPGLIAVAILLGTGVRTLVESVFGLRHFAAQAPILAALVTLLLAPPLQSIAAELVDSEITPAPGLVELSLLVFAASMGVSAIRFALAPQKNVVAPPSGAGEPRLYTRLPVEMRAPLLRLSVRDHYVDVVTEAGTTAVLIRLGDAITEVGGIPGTRVHRSHWVAASAVRLSTSASGKAVLQLSDGSKVPVSKTYRAAVQVMLDGIGAGGS